MTKDEEDERGRIDVGNQDKYKDWAKESTEKDYYKNLTVGWVRAGILHHKVAWGYF